MYLTMIISSLKIQKKINKKVLASTCYHHLTIIILQLQFQVSTYPIPQARKLADSFFRSMKIVPPAGTGSGNTVALNIWVNDMHIYIYIDNYTYIYI